MEIINLAIVQARMGSKRLPGKVLMEIESRPLIEILLSRLAQSKRIDKIILATTNKKEDDILNGFVKSIGYDTFRGSNEDVLNRFFEASKIYNPKSIIRITGDCPIIDSKLIDELIDFYYTNNFDYATLGDPPTFPDGLDAEIFSIKSLATSNDKASKKFEREHVTPFMRSSKLFRTGNLENKKDLSSKRWTVDEIEDFEVIKNIVSHFHPKIDFSWKEVLSLEKSHPEFFLLNERINRNEGEKMNSGQKLWKRAKKIIPGGNMLLSKRSEMFLPGYWPSYFSKADGCHVWDLDGNKLIDMSIMGIGTNILGYGNKKVDSAVKEVVNKGNMSTLNCPEEVYLSEKLIDLHPWSDMVRLARSGGEANAIAVRIARAASGKDKIAFCGYHGWHDWYLSTNHNNDDNLNQHLLPGLVPNGVPKILKNTAIPFGYNKIDELKSIINNHNDIGVIKMEVSRSKEPAKNFLEEVRKIATKNGIVLIFDECTSGFRETYGGLHKKFEIEPDMAMFGKALGNGYAITAVIGKKEIMEAAQDTFISSTFWTERIGPTAAIKTLEEMSEKNSWQYITDLGLYITKCWSQIAAKNNLELQIGGLPALCNFTIIDKDWLKYKTLISQEMLKQGYLASNSVYVCMKHNKKIIDRYIYELNKIFSLISRCRDGLDIDQILDGDVCHSGFKRLN